MFLNAEKRGQITHCAKHQNSAAGFFSLDGETQLVFSWGDNCLGKTSIMMKEHQAGGFSNDFLTDMSSQKITEKT